MKDLKSINKYFVKYKWRLLLGVVFVTISNLFGILPAQITRNALDVVVGNIDAVKLFEGTNLRSVLLNNLSLTILLFGCLLIIMAILKGVFMFLMRQTIIVMSRLVEYDQKNEIFQQYQSLGFEFYSKENTGDLMNRISEDVGRVRMYVGPAVMYTINLVVMFTLIIWSMVQVNARLATWVLIPIPIITFIVYKVQDHISKRSELVQEKLSEISVFIQEIFSGIRVVKSFARESFFKENYDQRSEDYKEVSMHLVKVNALFMPSMLLLVGLSTIITIYAGSVEVLNGRLTIGNIAEFVIYVNMLTWPVASMGWVVSIVQRASASQRRIDEFLNKKPHVVSGTYSLNNEPINVEFKNVSVVYTNSNLKALQGVSFQVKAGQSIGVIGKTGAGKSTLVQLLLRFFDPNNGEIIMNEKDLRTLNLKEYRSRLGCVPQEVFLFSDTIANNISFGIEEEVSQEEIHWAAKQAVIDENILQFPNGYETILGERGITLSGGQKQRVSIARAIIKKPGMLIFDDCLSAVDTVTEERILNNLKDLMKGKTTFLISHRISTVKDANQIIVLDKGQIIEVGTHQSLIEKRGVYFEMYQAQNPEAENS
ncbi:MAG: ABC transporter ATP-binding protein [Bacteroidota bacterium]